MTRVNCGSRCEIQELEFRPRNSLQLFSEFFRASNAKKMAEDGTGLGLAIVKQIVDMHGGHIRVNSREGEGTSFIIELPVGQS